MSDRCISKHDLKLLIRSMSDYDYGDMADLDIWELLNLYYEVRRRKEIMDEKTIH